MTHNFNDGLNQIRYAQTDAILHFSYLHKQQTGNNYSLVKYNRPAINCTHSKYEQPKPSPKIAQNSLQSTLWSALASYCDS